MTVDLRRVFEGLPAQILVLAPDGPRFTILAVSDAYLQATLTEREAILGKGVFEVFPDNPDDPETRAVSAATASFQRVVDERCTDVMGIRRHDVRRSAADGGGFAERYWRPVNSPLLAGDGRVECIVHQVEDVTDIVLQQQEGAELGAAMAALRGAEEGLRESEASARRAERRYRNLFDSMIEGFCTIEMVFDPAGRPVDYRFLEVNSAFEQQTGLHDAQGRLMRDLVPGLDAHWFEIFGRVATTGEAARFAAPAAALGRFYDVSAFRVGGPDSGQVAILFNDISQRKRLEEEKDLLLEAAGSLTESILLPDVLDRLARIILDVGGHGRVVISLWQEELECLTVARSRGDAALPDGMSVAMDDLSAPAQRSIEKRETFLIDYDDLEPGRRGMGDRFTSHLALWVPLLFGGRFVGLLATDDPGERRDFSERQIRIIEGIAVHAAVAIENARAYEAETAAQMKQAAQEERTRLARDLHDSITQALFAAALKAEVLTQDDAIHEGSAATAADVRRLTRGALAQMRTLLLELRSESLEDVPIEQLLRNAVEATEGRTSIAVGLKLLGDGETPRNLHTAIYRVTQEALNNVVRHSGASHASVELEVEPACVRLLVQDDGCGFRPGPESPAHLGLRSMRERAAEVGAALRVVSAPGEGTLVALDWRDGDATDGRPPSVDGTAPRRSGSGYPLK